MDYKKDSHVFGGLLGLVFPIFIYVLLLLIAYILKLIFGFESLTYHDEMRLASIALNLLLMRYYFVKLKFELTGRGILLVTFIYILVHFWIQ